MAFFLALLENLAHPQVWRVASLKVAFRSNGFLPCPTWESGSPPSMKGYTRPTSPLCSESWLIPLGLISSYLGLAGSPQFICLIFQNCYTSFEYCQARSLCTSCISINANSWNSSGVPHVPESINGFYTLRGSMGAFLSLICKHYIWQPLSHLHGTYQLPLWATIDVVEFHSRTLHNSFSLPVGLCQILAGLITSDLPLLVHFFSHFWKS